jgi:hypothetical protein
LEAKRAHVMLIKQRGNYYVCSGYQLPTCGTVYGIVRYMEKGHSSGYFWLQKGALFDMALMRVPEIMESSVINFNIKMEVWSEKF